MNYLLDTCVISEVVRKQPHAGVLRWLDEQIEQNLFLSVLTIGELNKGITRLPDGKRKDDLRTWLENDLSERFAGRIVPFDLAAAIVWGRMLGETEQRGETLPALDALIAATALANGFTVVTRNVRDLERCRVRVFNPWGE